MTHLPITQEKAWSINETYTFYRLVPQNKKIVNNTHQILHTQQQWKKQFTGYLINLAQNSKLSSSKDKEEEIKNVVQSMQAQFEFFQHEVKKLGLKIQVDYDTFKFTPDMKIYFQSVISQQEPKEKELLTNSFTKAIQQAQLIIKKVEQQKQTRKWNIHKEQQSMTNLDDQIDMTQQQFVNYFKQAKQQRLALKQLHSFRRSVKQQSK